MELDRLREWIGNTERVEDLIDPRRCAQLAGALDSGTPHGPGCPLPLPWHWIFFNPVPTAGVTGADGHPARGTFLPPVSLPRRMWAGGRVKSEKPLNIGDRAVRESVITRVDEKEGRQGRLLFVGVEHRYFSTAGDLALIEEQDIVYREAAAGGDGQKRAVYQPDVASQWHRAVNPDAVLLFRYSALTYNAHRIHYDRDWAVEREGYPGLVVQGPLTATLLLDLLYENRPGSRVSGFSFRGVSPLFDLAPFDIHGAMEESEALLWALTPEKQLAMSMSCRLANPS
jgi:3-methylfumaryl-CoA hydratase